MKIKLFLFFKLIAGIIVISTIFSCAKKPVNGKLDGRWQLMAIENHETGISLKPEYTYFDFQLQLMQLVKTLGDDIRGESFWGRFVHTGDSLHIRMIGTTWNRMEPFGLNDTIQRFSVEELTTKKMILNSTYSRLDFRKF